MKNQKHIYSDLHEFSSHEDTLSGKHSKWNIVLNHHDLHLLWVK